MHDAMLWFIGGAVLLGMGVLLGMVLAYFVWQDVTLADDADAPSHVNAGDWQRVTKPRRER
jgi:hypothetical protein